MLLLYIVEYITTGFDMNDNTDTKLNDNSLAQQDGKNKQAPPKKQKNTKTVGWAMYHRV